MKRLNEIDFVRGLIIVIMAIDHTRDLLHTTSLSQNPLDLATTTVPLFFTRWITHLCAPTFVFLAGTSVYLMVKNRSNFSEARKFLLTRGLWLVVLEFTIVSFGLWADLKFRTMFFEVISAIGMSFVILSLLLKLSARTIGIIGLAVVCLHNLIPAITIENTALRFLLTYLFKFGAFPMGESFLIIVAYPIIPWLGIMLLGYSFGTVFHLQAPQRRKIFLVAGLIALGAFVLLRFLNVYGDPVKWSVQAFFGDTLLSFINVTKYAPSLLFVAVTIGIMLLIMAWAQGRDNALMRFFCVFGRVPLFFFIVHFYVIHLCMFIMLYIQGLRWNDFPIGPGKFGRPDTGVGIELPFVYLFWICLMAFMYPICKWYGNYKLMHKEMKWLSYL